MCGGIHHVALVYSTSISVYRSNFEFSIQLRGSGAYRTRTRIRVEITAPSASISFKLSNVYLECLVTCPTSRVYVLVLTTSSYVSLAFIQIFNIRARCSELDTCVHELVGSLQASYSQFDGLFVETSVVAPPSLGCEMSRFQLSYSFEDKTTFSVFYHLTNPSNLLIIIFRALSDE